MRLRNIKSEALFWFWMLRFSFLAKKYIRYLMCILVCLQLRNSGGLKSNRIPQNIIDVSVLGSSLRIPYWTRYYGTLYHIYTPN